MEVEDIYFLTDISRRGAPISLTGSCVGDITTRELIDRHCVLGMRTLGKSSDRWAPMDRPIYYVEGGWESGCAPGF